MITILYPYRNRDLERVKRSLDSLTLQTDQRFKVLFVDYGSTPKQAYLVKQLINNYWPLPICYRVARKNC